MAAGRVATFKFLCVINNQTLTHFLVVDDTDNEMLRPGCPPDQFFVKEFSLKSFSS